MSNKTIKDNDKIDFGAILANYKRHWWWFAISLVVCLGLTFMYLKIKSPVYLVKSLVMFNQEEEDAGGAVGGLGALMSSFSLGSSGGANVEDEMMKMGSHSNMSAVVSALKLNHTYWSKAGLFDSKVWYYNDSPIEINIPQSVLDTIRTSTEFNIQIPANGGKISVEVEQADETIVDTEIETLPYSVKTPYGIFHIDTTSYYNNSEDLNFYAKISGNDGAIEGINKRFNIAQLSKKANGIQIDIEDVHIKRGKDFLNTLVDIYNQRSLADKNEQASSTAQFIEDRLLKLYRELETSETKIENYKRENQIVDAEAEAEYIFKKKETIEASIVELQTKIAVLHMIKEFLESPENKYTLVPFTADFPEDPISAYNELVLQRLNLEATAKGNNSALKNITTQVDAMRGNVISTLEKQIQSANIALADMSKEASSSEHRMSGIPRMERELTELYRDQVIKNEIYGYLLQKREENELKLSRNRPTGKVIDEAYAEVKPISPNKIMVVALGLFAGILIPIGLLSVFGKETSPTTPTTPSSPEKKSESEEKSEE